jgi:hypothetical protein
MNGAEGVIRAFENLGRELGVEEVTPVSQPRGMGKGTIKIRFRAAYCTADWCDRGFAFTLFLGRHFEIGGRRFITEFSVNAFEESAPRRVGDHSDIDVQIMEQFRLLRLHGLAWLRGDFSREPFIRHQVLPEREEA